MPLNGYRKYQFPETLKELELEYIQQINHLDIFCQMDLDWEE